MKSSVTRDFRRRFEMIPTEVQVQAVRAYRLWRTDPHYPGLQFKRVSPRQPIYSVRIGLNYRALGLQEVDHIYWFWIGTHAEYDELLKRL